MTALDVVLCVLIVAGSGFMLLVIAGMMIAEGLPYRTPKGPTMTALCARPGCGHRATIHHRGQGCAGIRHVRVNRRGDAVLADCTCPSFVPRPEVDPAADPQPPVEAAPWRMGGWGWAGETIPWPEEGT